MHLGQVFVWGALCKKDKRESFWDGDLLGCFRGDESLKNFELKMSSFISARNIGSKLKI